LLIRDDTGLAGSAFLTGGAPFVVGETGLKLLGDGGSTGGDLLLVVGVGDCFLGGNSSGVLGLVSGGDTGLLGGDHLGES
jgi:hypothetical protein